MLPIRAFSENAAGGENFRFSDRTELIDSAPLLLSSVAMDRQDLCVEKITGFLFLGGMTHFRHTGGSLNMNVT